MSFTELISLLPSMLPPAQMVLLLCLATIVLFISNRLPVDVVALLVLVTLGLLGLIPGYDIVTRQELFSGFSSNAVIAIIGAMIIGSALDRAGLMRSIARLILKLGDRSEKRVVALVCGHAGLLSAFMQNIAAAALFLPVINQITKSTGIAVSRLMMPMGFCVIVGGTLTMVGSGPLIILNDLLPAGTEPFHLFDVTPIGLALLAVTLLYFVMLGPRLLPASDREEHPDHKRMKLMAAYAVNAKVTLVRVPDSSTLIGQRLGEIESRYRVNIIAMETSELCMSPHRELRLEANASLAIMAEEAALQRFLADTGVRLVPGSAALRNALDPDISGVTELLISPHSNLVGQRIKDFRIRKTYGLTPLAIHRSGEILHHALRETALAAGDILLCHTRWDDLAKLERDADFTLLSKDFPHDYCKRSMLGRALLIFSITLLLMIFSGMNLSLALLGGAAAMVVSGVLSMEQAYQAISWKTVFLVAGLIPLGVAVDNSGAGQLVADFTINLLGDHPSLLSLEIAIALLATLFSLVISNIGAALLLAPLAAQLGLSLGVDPRICLLIVGVCVSNSFVIPTHQVNALILNPGNYRVSIFCAPGV